MLLLVKKDIGMEGQVIVRRPFKGCRKIGGFVSIVLLLLDKELDAHVFRVFSTRDAGEVIPVGTGTEGHSLLLRVAAADDDAKFACASFPLFIKSARKSREPAFGAEAAVLELNAGMAQGIGE